MPWVSRSLARQPALPLPSGPPGRLLHRSLQRRLYNHQARLYNHQARLYNHQACLFNRQACLFNHQACLYNRQVLLPHSSRLLTLRRRPARRCLFQRVSLARCCA